MTTVHTVGISDCLVTNDPASSLITHALGSCIAVLIHDPVSRVGGLLHFMLPESGSTTGKMQPRPLMYADTGIPMLLRAAYEMGALKQRLIVTAVGGAQLFEASRGESIGKRNYLSMKNTLWKASITLDKEDVGGVVPRTVQLDVGSGRVHVSHGREQYEVKSAHLAGGQ